MKGETKNMGHLRPRTRDRWAALDQDQACWTLDGLESVDGSGSSKGWRWNFGSKLHPGRLTWTLKTTGRKTLFRGPLSGSMLVFGSVQRFMKIHPMVEGLWF